jgi:hypothetical protein
LIGLGVDIDDEGDLVLVTKEGLVSAEEVEGE